MVYDVVFEAEVVEPADEFGGEGQGEGSEVVGDGVINVRIDVEFVEVGFRGEGEGEAESGEG